MFINQSLYIAKYVKDTYNQKISIAHNGSSISLIKTLLPYLDYVAIDFKGGTTEEIAYRSNIKNDTNSIFNILTIINIYNENNIIVDVRTVIFGDTSIDNLMLIGEKINNIPNVFWTLRKYNSIDGCDFIQTNTDNVKDILMILKEKFPLIKIGMRDKWSGANFYIP